MQGLQNRWHFTAAHKWHTGRLPVHTHIKEDVFRSWKFREAMRGQNPCGTPWWLVDFQGRSDDGREARYQHAG
jgi:hypothetical protein